jgi:elongation factor P
MLNFSEIKLGKIVEFQNAPCVIIECDFLRMQMRKPVKRCKMRNLLTNSVVPHTFYSNDNIEEADMRKEKATFLYSSDESLNFMLSESYETIEIAKEMLGSKQDYLKEGLEVLVVYFNDGVVSVEIPLKVSFVITQTNPVDKGNTVNGVLKEAIIETGKMIRVPAFIKEGEKIIVNTVEDEYVERDTSK